MTITVTRNGRWRLVGTPDEFASFVDFPKYPSLLDLQGAVANDMEGTTARFKDHRGWWELKGSRSDLATFVGVPEARTVAETLGAFMNMHPDIRVLSS